MLVLIAQMPIVNLFTVQPALRCVLPTQADILQTLARVAVIATFNVIRWKITGYCPPTNPSGTLGAFDRPEGYDWSNMPRGPFPDAC